MANYMDNDNATEVFRAYASKINKIDPISITWANYQLLSEADKNSHRYIITDYPAQGAGQQLGPAAYKDSTDEIETGSTDLIESGAVADALDDKVDKVTGKGLSTNDYSNDDKEIVNGLKTYNQYLPTKVLCIGDSYGVKIVDNWCKYLKTYMGLDNDHIVNMCTGSSGFVGNTGAPTYLDQLTNVNDKNTFTHIIIVGGFNDAYDSNGNAASESDLENAFIACKTYINEHFTKAKVYIGFAGYASSIVSDATYYPSARNMMLRCAKTKSLYDVFGGRCGWHVMSKISYILRNRNYIDGNDLTYGVAFHPTALGCSVIASAINSYLNDGDFGLTMNGVPHNIVTGDFNGSLANSMGEYLSDNISKFTILQVTLTGSKAFDQMYMNWNKLCDLTCNMIQPCVAPIVSNGYIYINNTFRCPAMFKLVNNAIEYLLLPEDVTAVETVTSITIMGNDFIGIYGDC